MSDPVRSPSSTPIPDESLADLRRAIDAAFYIRWFGHKQTDDGICRGIVEAVAPKLYAHWAEQLLSDEAVQRAVDSMPSMVSASEEFGVMKDALRAALGLEDRT